MSLSKFCLCGTRTVVHMTSIRDARYELNRKMKCELIAGERVVCVCVRGVDADGSVMWSHR